MTSSEDLIKIKIDLVKKLHPDLIDYNNYVDDIYNITNKYLSLTFEEFYEFQQELLKIPMKERFVDFLITPNLSKTKKGNYHFKYNKMMYELIDIIAYVSSLGAIYNVLINKEYKPIYNKESILFFDGELTDYVNIFSNRQLYNVFIKLAEIYTFFPERKFQYHNDNKFSGLSITNQVVKLNKIYEILNFSIEILVDLFSRLTIIEKSGENFSKEELKLKEEAFIQIYNDKHSKVYSKIMNSFNK